MAFGLEYMSTLVGTCTLTGQPDAPRPLRISAHVRIPNALRHLIERRAALDGTIDIEGFAADAELTGVLERVWGSLQGRCEFCFEGQDGETYRFVGELRPTELALVGDITNVRGERMAAAEARFDPKSALAPLLASVRPIRD